MDGSADVDIRLQLIGFRCANWRTGGEHTLWLIEHHPSLPIYAGWSVDSLFADSAKILWGNHLARSSDAQVFANAAWSLISHDQPWAEACYRNGDRVGDHGFDWWFAKAALFEVLADGTLDSSVRKRHSRTLLESLLEAFNVETKPTRQLDLLSSLHAATVAAAGPPATIRVAALAEVAGARAVRAGVEAGGRIDLHVARGFVELLRGRREDALAELELAKALMHHLPHMQEGEEGVNALERELVESS